jgi:hypothetical protein
MKAVVVDVSARPTPPPRLKYAVVLNKTRKELLTAARANPDVMIIPFVTGPASRVPDYRWLSRTGDAGRGNLLLPIYVGNLRPWRSAVRQIVAKLMEPHDSEEVKL